MCELEAETPTTRNANADAHGPVVADNGAMRALPSRPILRVPVIMYKEPDADQDEGRAYRSHARGN